MAVRQRCLSVTVAWVATGAGLAVAARLLCNRGDFLRWRQENLPAFDPCNERHTMPYWGMAVYRIIPDPDGTEVFQVEVEFPSGHLQVVAGFHTEAAAQEWITNQQIQAVKPAREA
jgi:hypothetical protein